MRRVGLPVVILVMCVAWSSTVGAQSMAPDTPPDTGGTEYGWVVASTTDQNLAKSLAARYELSTESGVAVVPVVIGSSQMYRVVVGRHRDFETALDSRVDLPSEAPSDSWLVELQWPATEEIQFAERTEEGDVAGKPNLGTTTLSVAVDTPGTRLTQIDRDTLKADDSHALSDSVTDVAVAADSIRSDPPASAPQHVELTSDTRLSDIGDPSFFGTIRRDNLSIELGYLSRFDSNIDHNEDDQNSFGMVPAVLMQLRSSRVKPVALLNYHFARHNYSGTDRWDRFSHLLVGVVRQDQEGAFRTETRGEISVAGTSEDRDLSDQYQVQQDLEYRFTDDYRLHFYGTLRWKRYDVRVRDEFKPNLGVEFEQKLDNGGELEVGVRWETKIIDKKDDRYKRWVFSLDYDIPTSATSELEFSIENRRKLYEFDEVEIEDEDFLRRDFRWKFGVAWTKQLTDRLKFKTDYLFERRDSNNPEKLFDAHLIDMILYFRL